MLVFELLGILVAYADGNDNAFRLSTVSSNLRTIFRVAEVGVTLINPREGYFRIEHTKIYMMLRTCTLVMVVAYEYKPLTEGQVVFIGQGGWDGH